MSDHTPARAGQPWYVTVPGWLGILGYVALIGLVTAGTADRIVLVERVNPLLGGLGLGPVSAPGLGVVIPVSVYQFALLGALTQFLLGFVMTVPRLGSAADSADPSADSPADPTPGAASADRGSGVGARSTGLLKRGLGVLAAPPLIAGVVLVVSLRTDAAFLNEGVSGGALGFVVGFFTRGAYRALGRVADRLLDPIEARHERPDTSPPRRAPIEDLRRVLVATKGLVAGLWSGRGSASESESGSETGVPGGGTDRGTGDLYSDGQPARSFAADVTRFLVFVLAVVGTVLLAHSTLGSGASASGCGPGCIPIVVYVYALLGGLGYVFTALLIDPDRSSLWLLKVALRVLAGMTLAAGFYLILLPSGKLAALIAYLVGLYTNVAVVRLTAFGIAVFSRLERSEESGTRS